MEDIIFMWWKIFVFIIIVLFVITVLIFLIIEKVQEKRIDKELYEKQTTVYKTSEEDITELIDEIKDHQKKINILLNRIETKSKGKK